MLVHTGFPRGDSGAKIVTLNGFLNDISVWYDGLNLFCCRGGVCPREKPVEILCHRVGYIDQYFFTI